MAVSIGELTDLYRRYLGRDPGPTDISIHIGGGLPYNQLERGFQQSEEGQRFATGGGGGGFEFPEFEMPEFSAPEIDWSQFMPSPEEEAFQQRLRDDYIARLEGRLPIPESLQTSIGENEEDLRATLTQRLGGDYETSTPGIEALAKFQTGATALKDDAAHGRPYETQSLLQAFEGGENREQSMQMAQLNALLAQNQLQNQYGMQGALAEYQGMLGMAEMMARQAYGNPAGYNPYGTMGSGYRQPTSNPYAGLFGLGGSLAAGWANSGFKLPSWGSGGGSTGGPWAAAPTFDFSGGANFGNPGPWAPNYQFDTWTMPTLTFG